MDKPFFYQPQAPARFADVSKLSPSDPIRTLTAIHASVAPIGEKIAAAAAAIDADSTLSDEGRKLAREKAFADHVAATIAQHDQALRLASLRHDERAAALTTSAVKAATVSDERALRVAEYLRDMPEPDRNRLVLESIMSGDSETISAILSAPAIFRVTTPALRERALTALVNKHDAAKAQELADFNTLIASIHESFESLARFARDRLQLKPPAAKPVRTGAAA